MTSRVLRVALQSNDGFDLISLFPGLAMMMFFGRGGGEVRGWEKGWTEYA